MIFNADHHATVALIRQLVSSWTGLAVLMALASLVPEPLRLPFVRWVASRENRWILTVIK
ncbi:hypothetical protein [Silvimonas iriomotensis]|uniref:Uncharacterized protein n=1 Tax=Silvimonas iriomotensis TaxID=449662 RepID=A0ABQ2PEG3_9NEIS|nr:hypothetical protein [Silvimonas iriomotensis]GGP23703.1 hypothetical protein GCM10010970_37030 [Silvimonas iriomotensis]